MTLKRRSQSGVPAVQVTANPIQSTRLLVVAGTLLFATFFSLGCWQIDRLSWKTQLIERVNQRVHAPASDAPTKERWDQVNAQRDEYRHVRVSGIFQSDRTIKVLASTVLGRGYWVMTPLLTEDGSMIWVNRGFVATAAYSDQDNHATPTALTGLLRMTETGGAFLHQNDPANQRWYSRDIGAMSLATHLSNAAPFFIDANAPPDAQKSQPEVNLTQPVAGLTVISFNNNHLVYSITWFGLAAMVAAACYLVVRSPRCRSISDHNSASPRPPG